MVKIKKTWLPGAALLAIIIAVPLWLSIPEPAVIPTVDPWATITQHRVHQDHTHFFQTQFATPNDVTQSCLHCHPNAAKDMMKTAHWKWLGDPVHVPGHMETIPIGKKNLLNNFCIGIQGNWSSCTTCHAGYGWKDDSYDFNREDNVDCLICHDWSGSYVKGPEGMPEKNVDLLAVARQVGYPKRDNCGSCHIYGGGGMGVKHGDLDNTLVNPTPDTDVHMGKENLLCIDCHKTEKHNITGKAYSVSVDHQNGINCTDCHGDTPHKDRRINTHLSSVACQTCHIPAFAKKAPTKTHWDWSKAGDPNRAEDPHIYLKIKGEFVYDQNITPEYFWFNLKSNRYLMGDPINPTQPTYINPPLGNINDPQAKIWPFKVHRAKQHYDKIYNYLLLPVTSGEGGFWHDFDWDKALRLGEGFTGLKYSGQYGFTDTIMQWPLSHMVSPASQALQCQECHNTGTRMNWKALGYPGDPVQTGGRESNKLIQKQGKQ